MSNFVIDGNTVLNPEGLRFRDEFVRHKLLDSLGDLRLAGYQLLGHFHGYKSGHALNNQLLQRLFADESAWRIIDLGDQPIAQESAEVRMRAAVAMA